MCPFDQLFGSLYFIFFFVYAPPPPPPPPPLKKNIPTFQAFQGKLSLKLVLIPCAEKKNNK